MPDQFFSPMYIQGAQQHGAVTSPEDELTKQLKGQLESADNDADRQAIQRQLDLHQQNQDVNRKARMEALRRIAQPQPDGRPMPGVGQQDQRLSNEQ